jgi:hypothetical protein
MSDELPETEVELPPLPAGTNFAIKFTEKAQIGTTVTTPMQYSADEMRSYARDAVLAEQRRIVTKLQPVFWTDKMSHAWHNAIPDVQKAFERLLNVCFTGDADKDIRSQKEQPESLPFRMVIDPAMPEDTVEFKDAAGKTLGRIVNIGEPT